MTNPTPTQPDWSSSKERSDFQRFIKKVNKLENGCWQWTGSINKGGYGEFWWRNRSKPVHQFAYTHFKGEIPTGLHIDHLCRNRACVNPEHLEVVTIQENNRRGRSFTALNMRKTHCKHGHPFSGENLLVFTNKEGQVRRICRTCDSLGNRKERWQKEALDTFRKRAVSVIQESIDAENTHGFGSGSLERLRDRIQEL